MEPRLRHCAVPVAVAALVLASADLAAPWLFSNSVPRQVIRTITNAPERIDVLAIGNSLMAAGFQSSIVEDRMQVDGRRATAINGALGATGLIEHLAFTRLALRHHTVHALVYGYFDLQMVDDVPSRDADLIGNRNVLYYLEPALTRTYAEFDLVNRLLFEVHRSSALLQERGNIWARVEHVRRWLGGLGMPDEETNRFGRRADFELLESRDSDAFERACTRALAGTSVLAPPMHALIAQARARRARVIVVEMPMHPEHVRRFYQLPAWERLRRRAVEEVERADGEYLDASTWETQADAFDDHLHLSAQGAARFSARLAEALASRPPTSVRR